MVGRPVELRVSKEPAQPGDVVLDVSNLIVAGDVVPSRPAAARNVGRRRLLPGPRGRDPRHRRRAGQRPDRAVRGADGPAARRPAPSAWTAGTSATPARGTGSGPGIAYIPEDRQEDGLVADFSVADNLVLDTYDRPPFASGIAMDLRCDPQERQQPGGRVRRAHLLDRHPGRHAVRRQPAEGDPGQGGGPEGPAAAGQPADPRPGRRLDRVRAPPDRRGTRPAAPR